jgi:hypothetical protein
MTASSLSVSHSRELSLMHLYPIDGAAHRVGSGETAWIFALTYPLLVLLARKRREARQLTVRWASFSEVRPSDCEVCSTPTNGHRRPDRSGPKSAGIGHVTPPGVLEWVRALRASFIRVFIPRFTSAFLPDYLRPNSPPIMPPKRPPGPPPPPPR